MKEVIDLKKDISEIAKNFIEKTKNKEIIVVSHFDTDGITSAAIIIKTLKKMDKTFSIKIIKSLDKEFILSLPKEKIILFLDLASGSLDYIKEAGFKKVFIIDHHEVIQEVPENVEIINPWFNGKEKISSSGLCYLFCKEINNENTILSKLAILGMIGDMLEKSIKEIEKDIAMEEIKKKKGLLIYPSTRPISNVLEYNSQQYIPGVTGDRKGVIELLRESGIEPINGKYKSLLELNEKEMKKLTTSIMLRNPKTKNKEMIGDIFLLKFFNRLEDARELSAMINACSRMGKSEIALKFCMEIPEVKKDVDETYIKYKRELISGLEFVEKTEKIEGENFVIINAKDKISDTIIGTIASILSNSPKYPEGTVIVTMARYKNKTKISSRISGSSTKKNLREMLQEVIDEIGGEVGGHEVAAGGIIKKEKEEEFIKRLKKTFDFEKIKI